MCKHRNSRRVDLYRPDDEGKLRFFKQVRLDACLADSNLVQSLNESGIKTLGSCCGHGKYHMSIIYESSDGKIRDWLSGTEIFREKMFYVRDKQGYFYIPEIDKNSISSNPRMLRREEKMRSYSKITIN